VFSTESETDTVELEKFLFAKFYQHKSLLQNANEVKIWLEHLFEKLCRAPRLMPHYFQQLVDKEGLERTVCDYIAGMTDRFCMKILEGI
jgi:dGTPase